MKLKWILLIAMIISIMCVLLVPLDDYPLQDRIAGCFLVLIFWSPALIAFVEDV